MDSRVFVWFEQDLILSRFSFYGSLESLDYMLFRYMKNRMIVGNEGGYEIGFLQGAHSKRVINFHAVHPKTCLRVLNLRSRLTNTPKQQPPPPPPPNPLPTPKGKDPNLSCRWLKA